MMNIGLGDYLGDRKSERANKNYYSNVYKLKQINISYGSMKIDVLQDRKPTLVFKY